MWDRSAIELVVVEALTVGLVLLAHRRLDTLNEYQRKLGGSTALAPAVAWKAGAEGSHRGWIARIFASADESHTSTRMWVRLIVPVIATVLLGQLLNVGGCNTTPTQAHLNQLDKDMKAQQDITSALDTNFVPRKEMVSRSETIDKLQAQRDKRIERLEDVTGQMQLFLMQEARHP